MRATCDARMLKGGAPCHHTQFTDVQAALRTLPPGSPAPVKLQTMARMSFARALGAVWLLPAMDLYVRAKLNVIGALGRFTLDSVVMHWECIPDLTRIWFLLIQTSFWRSVSASQLRSARLL